MYDSIIMAILWFLYVVKCFFVRILYAVVLEYSFFPYHQKFKQNYCITL